AFDGGRRALAVGQSVRPVHGGSVEDVATARVLVPDHGAPGTGHPGVEILPGFVRAISFVVVVIAPAVAELGDRQDLQPDRGAVRVSGYRDLSARGVVPLEVGPVGFKADDQVLAAELLVLRKARSGEDPVAGILDLEAGRVAVRVLPVAAARIARAQQPRL